MIGQRWNERGFMENYVKAKHLRIDDEGLRMSLPYNGNIHKNVAEPNEIIESNENWNAVPHYPRPVEFHVSRIAHVTTEAGLDGILDCNGFRGGERTGFLWWGLVIGPGEISDAEERYMEKLFPDQSPEERQDHFLNKFTTSPVFREESRYGNFRLSLSLADVLQAYSTQFCRGQEPVLKVYETVIYSQEIMYVVLIHSPDVHDYDDYPVLGDNDDGVCAYRDGKIIWRAQAICAVHRVTLLENREKKNVQVNLCKSMVFYVWDHVTLAFHMPAGKILEFSQWILKEALSTCEDGDKELNPLIGQEAAVQILMSKLKTL